MEAQKKGKPATARYAQKSHPAAENTCCKVERDPGGRKTKPSNTPTERKMARRQKKLVHV